MKALTLYGRPGCHLCAEARETLERLQIAYVEVDIESDDELLRRYLERIPVGVLDGEEVFELWVDEDALRGAATVTSDHDEPRLPDRPEQR